ncbi:hypothetical protein ALFP_2730 [Alcaligenes faecalis]|nr:hypothetical protein ALFP_2730 [Alcaligenes faecalis]
MRSAPENINGLTNQTIVLVDLIVIAEIGGPVPAFRFVQDLSKYVPTL